MVRASPSRTRTAELEGSRGAPERPGLLDESVTVSYVGRQLAPRPASSTGIRRHPRDRMNGYRGLTCKGLTLLDLPHLTDVVVESAMQPSGSPETQLQLVGTGIAERRVAAAFKVSRSCRAAGLRGEAASAHPLRCRQRASCRGACSAPRGRPEAGEPEAREPRA